MSKQLTIGSAAKRTGLSVKAIRFYEEEKLIPAVTRSESGYRLYSEEDVRRLRLLRQMLLLGMPLAQVRPVINMALDGDCAKFAIELSDTFSRQREEISRRIAELEEMRADLDELAKHVEHCECTPGQAVADCGFCPILDEEGGVPE